MRLDRLFARVADPGCAINFERRRCSSGPRCVARATAGFFTAARELQVKDSHANLQVTFMTELATGGLAADIDIDEASGIEHGFEVIRNAVFKNRNQPLPDSRVHECGRHSSGHSLSPDYDFTF